MSVKDFLKKVDKDKLEQALSSDDLNELRAVGQEAGYELSDEQLDYIAGGIIVNEWGSIIDYSADE